MRAHSLSRLVGLAIAAGAALAPAQAPDGSFDRPGVRLFYRSVGQGKPLVILAGGPGQDVRQLSGIIDRISDLRRCVLFDQRGTGRSKLDHVSADNITLDNYVEDLEALRQQLKLPKVSLLGHSWGAMLAAAYASKYPRHTGELILIGTGPLAADHLGPAGDNIQQRSALFRAAGGPVESKALAELRPFFFDQKKAEEFSRRSTEGHVSISVSQFLIPDMIRNRFDTRPGLRKLRARALILQGRQDLIPESFLIEMQSCIRGSKLVFVERAGHFSWIEQPEPFFAALRGFLKG